MGMYENLRDIVKVFRFDETLLRLLFYPAKDLAKNTDDPLDPNLPNMLNKNEEVLWEIRDKRIYTTKKADDLENDPICRIYVYAGKRKPSMDYIIASQEVVVDIFCHNSYEKDMRSLRISDCVNDLLISERITGFGKVEYVQGFPFDAPNDYVAFRHIYKFGSTKL
jgi:hypothetical protein